MEELDCFQPEGRTLMTLADVCFRASLYTVCGFIACSNACAACKPEALQLTPAMIDEFLRKPEILLQRYASSKRGTQDLSVSISQYAAEVPTGAQAIKSILPGATLQQREAIGKGLYRAVAFCEAVDPAIAIRIKNVVKSIGDNVVTHAYLFAESLSDPPIDNSPPQSLTKRTSAQPPVRERGLIGEPSLTDPGSLKLADPFRPIDAWK